LAGLHVLELARATPYHFVTVKRFLTAMLMALLATGSGLAQLTWEIPHRDREILMDGRVDEWEGVPGITLSPGETGLRSSGEFGENDVQVLLQALWDEQYLYLAVTWEDNVWDVSEVPRRDAVWVDSEGIRRDRMFFFDNLKWHIRTSDYDYTMWFSPRTEEAGPFYWHRLLEGYRGMERAAGTPMITVQAPDPSATVEVMMVWKQLRLEAEKGREFPLAVTVADADFPDRLFEFKLNHLKWLSWRGRIRTIE
jgi:hypothetical protein